jgi:hypothetical protein
MLSFSARVLGVFSVSREEEWFTKPEPPTPAFNWRGLIAAGS